MNKTKTVKEADKTKAILDMAKAIINNLYDKSVKEISELKRTKEKIENDLHEATMEAGLIVSTIVKSTNINVNDFANALITWRMQFREEQESVKSMVEVNNTSFDKSGEMLYSLDLGSQTTDLQAVLSIIFDTVDKASYVYQRKSSFEEKYKDYIPLATKIDDLSDKLYKINHQLERSRRNLASVEDINNYLFGSPDVLTLANPSSIIDKIRAINVSMASQDMPFFLTLTNNPSSMAGRIRAIETGMTPQDRFFLMAALVIVTVTRQR